jgi:hypothetical protein
MHPEFSPAARKALLRAHRSLPWWILMGLLLVAATFFLSGLVPLEGNGNATFGAVALAGSFLPALFGWMEWHQGRQIRRVVADGELLAVWTCPPEDQAAFFRRFPRSLPGATWVGRRGIVHGQTFYSWSPDRIRRYTLHPGERPSVLEVEIAWPAAVSFISIFAAFRSPAPRLFIALPAGRDQEAADVAVTLGWGMRVE